MVRKDRASVTVLGFESWRTHNFGFMTMTKNSYDVVGERWLRGLGPSSIFLFVFFTSCV